MHLRGHRLQGRPRAGHAVRPAGRCRARLSRRNSPPRNPRSIPMTAGSGAASLTPSAMPSGRLRARCRHRPQGPMQIQASCRRRPTSARRVGGKVDLGVRAHEHVPDLLPGPADGDFRRLRGRQIDPAVDDGPQHRCRSQCRRPDRRARPRGQGIHRGLSGRGGHETHRGCSSPRPTSRRWCAARPPTRPSPSPSTSATAAATSSA